MAKRILICSPQVPFVRGGAEYLAEGLRDALRDHGHTVDIVSLPYVWHPGEHALQSALVWRLLDITTADGQEVDQVICTKFPAYIVQHPYKVVWLVHQLRQAYDWYGTPMSDFVNIKEHRTIREALLAMDRRALGEARARYTISQNVSHRLHRYNGLDSTVLYPPSRYASRLYAADYGDYILSCSRLDRAKRVDLLLHALAHSRTARAIIAGTGPDQARLEQLAKQLGLGGRVAFRGFVDDATLIDLYARARAVYYAPIDEDYGFATVEACGAARPVITTDDAGGVLEFVTDGVNGYVLPAEPAALAERLDLLLADAALAAQLGAAGVGRVQGISWERVVAALVG